MNRSRARWTPAGERPPRSDRGERMLHFARLEEEA
jgi:hypothetical protein